VTPALAAKMCNGLPEQESARLKAVPFQGLLCASLVLEKPLADFYLTYLMAEDLPFTAVVEMSSMVDPAALGGKHLIYLPLYLSAEDPRFQQSDDQIRVSFLAGLKRIYPAFEESHVTAFRVSRVAEVFPLPVLDFSSKQPPASSALPGLHFVNAAHILNGTLNVNETVGLAERVATSLLQSDGLQSENHPAGGLV
jgi:protoporphyrinogen oxidase